MIPENPITREEQYLANIAGLSETKPDYPITRAEQYLDYIAENGGGGGGSDLPDPAELNDGTALIAVNGEWKAQSGYGYDASAFETIEWDGDTTGRAVATYSGNPFYKVSDLILPPSSVMGATATVKAGGEEMPMVISEDNLAEFDGGWMGASVISASAGVVYGGSIVVPEDGTYFVFVEGYGYGSSLAAPSAVHKIDPKYLYTIGTGLRLENGVLSLDVESGEGAEY